MLRELFNNRKIYKFSENEIDVLSKELIDLATEEIGKDYQKEIERLNSIINLERKKNINIEKAYSSLALEHEVVKAKLNKFMEALSPKKKEKIDRLEAEIFGAGENEGV